MEEVNSDKDDNKHQPELWLLFLETYYLSDDNFLVSVTHSGWTQAVPPSHPDTTSYTD
jgi:hypothetical protein